MEFFAEYVNDEARKHLYMKGYKATYFPQCKSKHQR